MITADEAKKALVIGFDAMKASDPNDMLAKIVGSGIYLNIVTQQYNEEQAAEMLADIVSRILLGVDGLAVPFHIALKQKMDTN